MIGVLMQQLADEQSNDEYENIGSTYLSCQV